MLLRWRETHRKIKTAIAQIPASNIKLPANPPIMKGMNSPGPAAPLLLALLIAANALRMEHTIHAWRETRRSFLE